MPVMRLSCTVLAAVLGACSGSSGSQSPAGGGAVPAQDPEASRRAESERQLRAAQESAVEAMCDRLVDCSVEEARATMTPEEVAGLDLENTMPLAREECEDESTQRNFSPRQVRVVQRCVTEAATCEALHSCLDEAKKRAP